MEKIIRILMRRDELTREEAIDLIKETREMMMEVMQDDPEEAMEIFESELGLEPDYIMYIL